MINSFKYLKLILVSLKLTHILYNLNQQLECIKDEQYFVVDDLIGYEIVFEAILVTIIK